MRQRKTPTSRSERLFLLLLALLTLSGLALYAFAPHTPPATLSMTSGAEGSASPQPTAQAKKSHRDTFLRDPHYVGPPEGAVVRGEKFAHYVHLDLNRIDSLTLLRIPGVGPAFAHRILALRERLGGYYTVLQLQEVYGMDEDKFLALRPWFVIKTPPKHFALTSLRADSLPWHPYLSRAQSTTLRKLLLRHGKRLSWSLLRAEGAFTREDSIRLSPYFVDASSHHPSPDSSFNQP